MSKNITQITNVVTSSDTASIKKRRSVGRPRILDRERVIAAAIEIGPDNVTMEVLATHLNVGVATLYKYFSGREQLMQMVVDEMMRSAGSPQRGELSWPDYARLFYSTMQQSMIDQPSVIQQLLDGGFGSDIGAQMQREFVAQISSKELPKVQSTQLYQALCQIAIGGAVTRLELHAQKSKISPSKPTQSKKGRSNFTNSDLDSTSQLLLNSLIDNIKTVNKKR